MNEIPSILKKAIQEKGYTQERFANETGIPLPTLKDYLSGKTKYDYDTLLIFSDKLDCSLDYLMGLSKSPVREHHEIAEIIGLNEEAITILEENKNNTIFNELLEQMLKDKDLINDICLYIAITKPVNEGMKGVTLEFERKISEELKGDYLPSNYTMSIEKQMVISLVMDIEKLKNIISKDLAERISGQIGMPEKEFYSNITSLTSRLKFPSGVQ